MRKNEDYYRRTEEILLLKNYSRNTRYNYLRILKSFIPYMNKSVLLPEEKIRNFLLEFENRPEQLKQVLCAVKFFYRYVLDKPCPFSLTKIRKKKRLPAVFTNEEIWKILNTIKNKNHFLMIQLADKPVIFLYDGFFYVIIQCLSDNSLKKIYLQRLKNGVLSIFKIYSH